MRVEAGTKLRCSRAGQAVTWLPALQILGSRDITAFGSQNTKAWGETWLIHQYLSMAANGLNYQAQWSNPGKCTGLCRWCLEMKDT